MIQLCDQVLRKPLNIIFSLCMKSGIFLTEWKMANVLPIHIWDDKNVLKFIVLYLCISLNVSFTITCAHYLLKTTSYLQINLILSKVALALTHLFPMYPFLPAENIRKLQSFIMFLGGGKGANGTNWLIIHLCCRCISKIRDHIVTSCI